LFNLRKRGRLSEIPASRRTDIDWKHCDAFLFASEIAWKKLMTEHKASSLDDILCDPKLAADFDRIAENFAPGFKSLDYRWAALKLRKMARSARTRARLLTPGKFQSAVEAFTTARKQAPSVAGVYLVSLAKEQIYAGETLNLKQRFEIQFQSQRKRAWPKGDLQVRFFTTEANFADLIAYQSIFIGRHRPRFNAEALAPV
jgi:site-specific DNA-methyltransferase (adenine-specific)